MKKKLVLSLIAAAILGSGITAYAASQYMADGAVFDPEWHLEQNPDVAAWQLGTSAAHRKAENHMTNQSLIWQIYYLIRVQAFQRYNSRRIQRSRLFLQ
ncbi:MAG: hypothetical protein HFH74_11860 [Lachnospiraceae bacterium]|jgi:hypothetical protein|nr:hypothetical protein [Lachnospiraceae bacterium]